MTALPLDLFSPLDEAVEDRLDGLRVALFTGAYNHIADGVALTLNRLVSFLEEHGAEVLVFAPTSETPAVQHSGTLDPVRSISLPGRPDYRISLGLGRSQRRRLEAFAPDLFHIATPDLLGIQAMVLAHRMGVPVVSTYHTHFTSYLEFYRLGWLKGLTWRLLRTFYRSADHVYVPTPTMVRLLAEHGIDEGIHLWPRGVDTARFRPDRRDLAWRRSLGFGDDDVVVTFVSRLVWEKGLDVFADTIDRLTRLRVPHRTLIVGEGPARAALQELLPEAVFVGHLGGDDLARAYASSDVFVFPSETETFGNVTLEAMASGLPTVCADAPGSDALVRPGRTGFLETPRDSDSMARRVATLIVDDRLRTRMGLEARIEAERYSWSSVLGRIAGYYTRILEPRPAEAVDAVPVISTQAQAIAA